MSANSSTPARAEPRRERGAAERAATADSLSAPERPLAEFTPATLARFDGKDPLKPVLIAYHGRVYDVSGRFMWMNGRHFWLRAGRDLTGHLHEAPHGEEMLRNVPCVGVLVTDEDTACNAGGMSPVGI